MRDLLLGKTPKDFDIATNALPRKVRRMFANSRVIGKRFRLVHVQFHDKIIEVSTFRSNRSGSFNNDFGTIAEDVNRRDFTFNALYYDPQEEYIVDYVGGYDDVRTKRLRSLSPATDSFGEDPVRMIRAVKYASITGFSIPGRMRRIIKRKATELANCPRSRMTEELFKILGSGHSELIFNSCIDLGLLQYILPEIDKRCTSSEGTNIFESLKMGLRELDLSINDRGETGRGQMLAYLTMSLIDLPIHNFAGDVAALTREVILQIKDLIAPLTPPNVDIFSATRVLLSKQGVRAVRMRRRRRR